jgi:hypothetical protein
MLSKEKLSLAGLAPVPKLFGAKKQATVDYSKNVSGHSVRATLSRQSFFLSGLALFSFAVNLAPAKNLLSSRNVLNRLRQTFV